MNKQVAIMMITTPQMMAIVWFKKTHSARGWTAAGHCTNCVYTVPAPEMWTGFRFLGKSAVAPCHLAGSAPHKSGGRRVKSWSNDTFTNKHTPALSPVIWTTYTTHTWFI